MRMQDIDIIVLIFSTVFSVHLAMKFAPCAMIKERDSILTETSDCPSNPSHTCQVKASPLAFSESSSLVLRGKAFLHSSSILGSRPADRFTEVTGVERQERKDTVGMGSGQVKVEGMDV